MVIVNQIKKHNPPPNKNLPLTLKALPPKEKRRRLKRSLKVLPNLFTLGNAFFGFCAIAFAANKNPHAAALCILLGASMDALDGRIARLIHSTSDLGMQLDSLADAITFCVAPAFTIYICNPNQSSVIIFLSCALYLLAGLFRLARFNVTNQLQTTSFIGLPTTLAGCFIAIGLLSFPVAEHELATALLMIALAGLKISHWRFPTFKQTPKRNLFKISIIIGVTIATFGFNKVLFGIYTLYFAIGAITTLQSTISKKKQQF